MSKMMCRFTLAFLVYITLSIVARNNVNAKAIIANENAINNDSVSYEESGIPPEQTLTLTGSSSSTQGSIETEITEEASTTPATTKLTPEVTSEVTTETKMTTEIGASPESRVTPGDPCTNDNIMFVQNGETLLTCLNNTLSIFGCKLKDGAILSDGDTIVKNHYLLQCQINDDKTAASAVQIACHIDDRILGPGQTYVDGSEYYTCTWKNDTNELRLEKSGCVDHEKKKIKEGETIVNGYYVYKCTAVLDDPGTLSMRFVRDGCAFENYPYKQGQIVIIGDYWYTCEKSIEEIPQIPSLNDQDAIGQSNDQNQPKNIQKTPVFWIKPRGCIVDFGFLELGEIFHKKGYVYSCDATTSNNNVQKKSNDLPADWPFPQAHRTMVGCLEVTPKMTIVEHFPGDRWLDTSRKQPGQKFMVECMVDKKEQILTKTVTDCYLDEVEGQKLAEPKTLKPGCMARIKNALWTCGKNIEKDTNQERIESKVLPNAGLEDTIYAILSGFAFC